MKKTIAFLYAFLPILANAIPSDHGVDYDIVYVRYPNGTAGNDRTKWAQLPQGEQPYRIQPGADLMLLKPNGTTEVIVDCTSCAVMDPFISYDGTTVYYSKMLNVSTSNDVIIGSIFGRETAGYIFKVDISGGAPYTEVQLTYPRAYDGAKYAGNTNADDLLNNAGQDNGTGIFLRDMAPVPLSNGKILFTSNQAGLVGFNQKGALKSEGAIPQQMYIMDDHDGTKNTVELANIKRLTQSDMRMVQHPLQLKDGRIMFTTWQDFAHKQRYSMSELFTISPDGSNLQQFTEPHDHNKNVNHFITQLANTDIVAGWYYPNNNWGFGVLAKYGIAAGNGDFLRESITQTRPYDANIKFSYREFDRPNFSIITPHTTNADTEAPNRSGKYAMPSWAKGGNMLVAYSTGYTNNFSARCGTLNDPINTELPCEDLKSGVYLFKNVATTPVTDPTNTAQLAVMIDDANYNEIWPRAVVPYNDVFGQSAPDVISSVREAAGVNRTARGQVSAIIGTSSMINRETSINETGVSQDGIFGGSWSRELQKSRSWTVQGTDVGIYSDSDIYGVRILAIPETPFTSLITGAAIDKYEPNVFDRATANNIQYTPFRYASTHNERWEILGEFPLTHKGFTDLQGNPDTSWKALIPAETNTTIQAIDINGMTLNSESVWRSLAPGEERTDCGGCHAHSVETTPLLFEDTKAGQGEPITGVTGVADTDERIQFGMWDLTSGTVPLIGNGGGVDWVAGKTVDYEFYRDINPIFQAKCNSCHTAAGNNGGLILDGPDPWLTVARTSDYIMPQVSKYIRSPQARRSMIVWVAYGQRLDGRTNGDDGSDVDYPDAHPSLNLTFEEKRSIARWVDLGAPVNMPNAPNDGFKYTDDNQLPHIEIYSPRQGLANANQPIRFGVMDAQSAIDWATLSITYYDVATPGTVNTVSTYTRDAKGVVNASLPSLTAGNDYVLTVSVDDVAGNNQTQYSRFTAQTAATIPTQPASVGVNVQ